jgi:hypothetical protein
MCKEGPIRPVLTELAAMAAPAKPTATASPIKMRRLRNLTKSREYNERRESSCYPSVTKRPAQSSITRERNS